MSDDVPVHTSTATDPAGRGEEFGAAFADGIAATIATYRERFAAVGVTDDDVAAVARAVGASLDPGWPDLAVEMRAMAGAAGVHPHDLVALNARTEVIAVGLVRQPWASVATECSTLAGESPEHGAWLVQNWDWYPEHAASRVVWQVPRTDRGGRGFTTFTEMGILAKVGLNTDGVAVGLNWLASTADGRPGSGLPIHLALRAALQHCADWVQVETLLRNATFTASSCITVVSGTDGTARAVEVSPSGIGVVVPDGDGILRHTNHFTSGIAVDLPPDPAVIATTEPRLSCLVAARPDVHGGSPEWAERVLSTHDEQGAVCRHDGDADGQTLAQLTMAPDRGRMAYTDGPPCRSGRTSLVVGVR